MGNGKVTLEKYLKEGPSEEGTFEVKPERFELETT